MQQKLALKELDPYSYNGLTHSTSAQIWSHIPFPSDNRLLFTPDLWPNGLDNTQCSGSSGHMVTWYLMIAYSISSKAQYRPAAISQKESLPAEEAIDLPLKPWRLHCDSYWCLPEANNHKKKEKVGGGEKSQNTTFAPKRERVSVAR